MLRDTVVIKTGHSGPHGACIPVLVVILVYSAIFFFIGLCGSFKLAICFLLLL